MIISNINHKVRVKLGMTCSEYVLLDYLYDLQLKNKKPSGKIVEKDLGFDKDETEQLLKALVIKELYAQGGIISDSWKAQFNFAEEFAAFWEIFLKKGNRAKSQINYCKCRRIVDKDVLFDAAERYIKSKEGKERQFIKGCESWLNPAEKHWEDVITFENVPSTYKAPKKEL